MTGIEPARPKALEPKSSASASSATSATDVFKLFAWNNFYIITSFELSVNTFLKLVLSSGTLGSGPVGMSPYHSIYITRFRPVWQYFFHKKINVLCRRVASRYSLSISIFISMDRRHTLRNHGFASKHYRSFSSLAIFEPKYCNHKIPSRINAFRLIRLGIFSSIANYVSYQVHAFNSRWMIITDRQEHIGCWHGSSALSERSNRGNMPHGQRYSGKPI